MKQIYAFFKKSQINNPSPADCRGQAGLAGAKKKDPPAACAVGGPEGGGYLLSRFRSTIGAAGFNFSVRDGKRWISVAIDTF